MSRTAGEELHARVGELRRLTIVFCDLVGSTELSARWEPEAYRELMRDYRAAVREVIESSYEGHIVQLIGDGVLAVFGFPLAHENDAERGVHAALALVRAVHNLSAREPSAERELDVRVAVHHGPLYVDLDEDDVYGLATNVGARLQSIAPAGTVVISEQVRELVAERFEIEPGRAQTVKGVDEPLQPFLVRGERRTPVQRAFSTPLVERDAQLAGLRALWAQADADGLARGALLCGEAGVGKSRLLAAFVEEPCCAGAEVIELPGSPFHADAGFHPVRTLIEHRCGISAEDDPQARLGLLGDELTRLGLDSATTLPLLAALAGIAPDAGYAPVAAEGPKLEQQVAAAAKAYVEACAASGRALVVAEDMHWHDRATRGVLDDLIAAGNAGLLVLATSREHEDGAWETFELAPLGQAARLELIDSLQPVADEDERLALAARSGGIPLYLEELVRARSADRPAAAGDAAPIPGSVPEALYEPLVARLYATPGALPVAATAAAAGEEADRSLLAATIALPGDELDLALASLLDAGILEPVAGSEQRYRFRHELLREVAYELQPPSWRRKVHDRLGDFLARERPGDWRALALHFERAERFQEAGEAYSQTAEAARRRGALQESRSHLSRAIELIAPLSSEHPAFEVDLRLRRGFLAMSLEGAASMDAAADYERCLQLAAGEPGSPAMIGTLVSLWSYYLSRAELGRVRQTSTTLRSQLSGPGFFRPQNLAGFGMVDWFEGSFPSALETLTTATEELQEQDRPGDLSHVWFVPIDATAAMYVYLAVARFMSCDGIGADAGLARAHAIADRLEFPQGAWSADYAHWLGSWIWLESGRLDEARAALEELRTTADLHGFDTWQLIGATQLAAHEALAALRGGEADAAALAEHAAGLSSFIEFWKALELRVFLPFYLTTCGALLADSGDAKAARARYEESLQLAAGTGMRFYDAETSRLIAHLAGDEEAKVAGLRDALALARSQGARPFELRIALDLYELLGEPARGPLERAMARFPQDATMLELQRARSRVSTAP